GATLSGAAAQDIALQSPVLSYLGVIDAEISGAMRASVDAEGMVEQFAATLEIGQGALQPTPKSQPIAFNSGQIYLTFDPAEQRIEFSQVTVQSDQLRVEGEGHAYLRDFDDGLPEALVAQLEFPQIAVAPEGLFAGALTFDKATADVRMQLAPFQLEIGQIALADGPRRYLAGGRIAADEGGWSLALDAQAPSLTPERLMQLWPPALGPKTREWVARNVLAGEISNIHAALRLGPGTPPRYGLSYDFQNAEARFLPNLPPITGGHGQSAIWDDGFSLTLHQGQVAAAEGGMIDLAGSTFKVANIHARPGRGDIRLKTDSSLTALLSVLSNRPFRISERTGRSPDLAEARAQLEGHINVALKKNTPLSDVAYEANGTLRNVTSTDLVPGYTLSSRELQVDLVTGDLAISGPILLDGLPLNIAWTQPLTPERASTSRISGQVELSDRFTDTFGIPLPTGTVSGRGVGELNLEVTRDAPIAFSLRSDLQGVGLTVPSLRWSKAAESPGALTITGQLGKTATIDRLAISGPGLEAEGNVEIGAGGGFGAVEFSRLEVGNWLNAAVRIEGTGARPGVRVIGGEMDIRNLDLAAQRQGASGGGPVSLDLDRLIITDTIALAPFSAQVTTGGGLNGTFKARVNGGAPIEGSLVPTPQGTAVRIISERAGAVARDAGFLKTLAGGTMDLILRPRKEAEGYDGRLRIRRARLRDQPAMAALLDAISVVGLLDEMNGPGISFETMEADFRLTSKRLYLDQGAAVGPSLGISLQGTYDIATKELDMQGVISPVYILNGIGQIFSRPGEGLFGFNYRIRGSSDAPRLSVNPLSILTPGMFREIFRSAPPNLEE
ncbi:MAG: DUF3971 domain-containing protein, partial [Alphaproteobacteria bacterium]|nr:DUF3971 domain-containing protein [Alphaproteobacteria bacterium]